MTLPLYKNNYAPTERPINAHAGLWYERFFDQFGHEWQVKDEKTDWLKNNFNRSTGNREQLEKNALKQLQMAEELKGKGNVFTTQWHFVSGMGNPHPVENGLSWHPTLGVPYLTGAAVKGIVRSWLEVWEKQSSDKEQKQKLLKWFGSTSKNPEDNDYESLTGSLIFFDAIPIEPVLMHVDIMTPHMGKWYEKGGDIKSIQREPEKVPADWHDPTPIPFLAIKKASFLFSFAPKNKKTDVEMREVLTMLENALDFIGAGAKTAVGYGQMLINQSETETLSDEIEKQSFSDKLQSMTAEQQLLAELQKMLEVDKVAGNNAPGNPTYQRLIGLIKQADEWVQADKNQLAEIAEEIFGFIGWGKGKKKREKKDVVVKLRGEL